jgi:hypothetical protein
MSSGIRSWSRRLGTSSGKNETPRAISLGRGISLKWVAGHRRREESGRLPRTVSLRFTFSDLTCPKSDMRLIHLPVLELNLGTIYLKHERLIDIFRSEPDEILRNGNGTNRILK